MAKKDIKSANTNMIFDYKVSDKTSKNKAVLVTLEGYATLSGDRSNRNKHLYPGRSAKGVTDSFWDGVMSGSKMVKEMLDTKTFFGCSRHPNMKAGDSIVPEFGDKKTPISHAIREYQVDDKGVYVILDILDNDAGREIKTYVDYGSKIGISTRALGEIDIDKEGYKTPKMDSYQFITWDLVTFPAFSATRMAAMADAFGVEADSIIGVSKEEFITGLQNLPKSEAKSICDYTGIEYSEAGLDVEDSKSVSELEEALDQAMVRIKELEKNNMPANTVVKEVKDKYKTKIRSLSDDIRIANVKVKEHGETINILEDKNTVLEAKILRLTDSIDILKKKYTSSKRTVEMIQKERDDFEEQLSDKITELTDLNGEITKLNKSIEVFNSEKGKQLRLINILQDKIDSINYDSTENNNASTDGVQTINDEPLVHNVIEDSVSNIENENPVFDTSREENFDAKSLNTVLQKVN